MNGTMLVLGIETSCDETAAAVVAREADGSGRILSSVVLSQIEEHAPFGGVVPEIAARAHVEALDAIIARALTEADVSGAQLSAVAATCGPGLQGGLLVGAMTGKAMAFALQKPFLAINHLEAHALTVRLTDGLAFPFLMLLVSGGHTQILLVEGAGRYQRLATTIDDAVGEAFDKVAKLLGLPYPGGPAVEREAKTGNPARFDLPRPMVGGQCLAIVTAQAVERSQLCFRQIGLILPGGHGQVADQQGDGLLILPHIGILAPQVIEQAWLRSVEIGGQFLFQQPQVAPWVTDSLVLRLMFHAYGVIAHKQGLPRSAQHLMDTPHPSKAPVIADTAFPPELTGAMAVGVAPNNVGPEVAGHGC